jgi:FkbM family methyltransferase
VFGGIRQRLQTAGVYEDGWVARRADVTLHGEGDVVELRGSVPPLFDGRRPQRLELWCDGRRIGSFETPAGEFTLAVPVAAGREGRLTLRARRTFSGAKQRINDDTRRLAFRLRGVRRRAATDVETWESTGVYADGWAAPVLRLRVRARGRGLRLRGSVPDAPQRLEIRATGRGVIARFDLDAGEFDVSVAVPDDQPLLDLELRGQREVDLDEPASLKRVVSLRLTDIAWSGGSTAPVLQLPAPPPVQPFGRDAAFNRSPRAGLLAEIRRRAALTGAGALQWVLRHPVRTLHPNLLRLRRRGETRRRRTTTFWGARMTVYPPEVVSGAILRWGMHDPDLSAVLVVGLGRGKTFFDVGAHFGYFSVLADHVMEGAGHVHAFEPTPSSFAVLTENIAGHAAIRATAAAVWRDEASAMLSDYGPALTAFNSLRGARIPGLAHEPSVTPVRTLSLDHYCDATGVKPDLVKIDAEGAESDILEGMSSLVLPRLRPFVALEVGDMNAPGVAPSRAVVDRMLAHGYDVWESHLGDFVPHQPRHHYGFTNLIFTPRR